MIRIIETRILPSEDGRPLRDVIKGRLKISTSLYASLKQKKNAITLNGEEAHADRTVRENDILRIKMEDEESSENVYPVKGDLDIIYEDEDVLAVNKPSFLPCHPSKGHVNDSLANIVAGYYGEKGEKFIFRCATRLDRDTSGIVIIAKNRLSHDLITEQMKTGVFQKTYYALSEGEVSPSSGRINKNIRRVPDAATIKREVCDDTNGATAVTDYEVIRIRNGRTLLKIQTLTGRTHQIRVHLASIGYPIVGDWLYGEKSDGNPRQLLHCGEVRMNSPITGKPLLLKADVPEDFGDIRY